jgi:hypothetical protein
MATRPRVTSTRRQPTTRGGPRVTSRTPQPTTGRGIRQPSLRQVLAPSWGRQPGLRTGGGAAAVPGVPASAVGPAQYSLTNLPVDASYDAQVAALQQQRANTLAALAGERTRSLSDYGFQEGPNGALTFDPRNTGQRTDALTGYETAVGQAYGDRVGRFQNNPLYDPASGMWTNPDGTPATPPPAAAAAAAKPASRSSVAAALRRRARMTGARLGRI